MKQLLLKFYEDESGATAIEYRADRRRHRTRDHCHTEQARIDPGGDLHNAYDQAERRLISRIVPMAFSGLEQSGRHGRTGRAFVPGLSFS